MKLIYLNAKVSFTLLFGVICSFSVQAFELEKDGKKVTVTKEQFFDHFLSQAKGKYILVPVPDG